MLFRRLVAGLAFAGLLVATGASAQAPATVKLCVQAGATCTPVNATNPLPVNASVSASIAGFPTVQTTGTPIAVTTGGVTGTLPSGAVVVASNVGTTNGAYCKLGSSATTSDQLIPPNSWFAFTVGANTQLTCITSTSTTTVNMVGGSGLPTGSGGGGSGGSGGAVTQGNAGSNAQAWWAQIGDTARGPAKVQAGNSAATTDVALTVSDPNVLAAVNAAIPAGTNLIGKVGIDQTTDGTTNGVRITNAYPSGATPITASATGTTAATTATLAGTTGKTTYICGYSIRANATAATTVTNTITGVVTATLSSIMWVAPLASGIGIDEQIFSPCIPASATNTGIAIVSGAPGSGGTVSSKGWGYQQ